VVKQLGVGSCLQGAVGVACGCQLGGVGLGGWLGGLAGQVFGAVRCAMGQAGVRRTWVGPPRRVMWRGGAGCSVLVVALWRAVLRRWGNGCVWALGCVASWCRESIAAVVARGMQPLRLAFVSQMAGVALFCIGGGVVAGGLQPWGEQLCMGARLCRQGV
jgi:hypothetical protein